MFRLKARLKAKRDDARVPANHGRCGDFVNRRGGPAAKSKPRTAGRLARRRFSLMGLGRRRVLALRRRVNAVSAKQPRDTVRQTDSRLAIGLLTRAINQPIGTQ